MSVDDMVLDDGMKVMKAYYDKLKLKDLQSRETMRVSVRQKLEDLRAKAAKLDGVFVGNTPDKE